MNDYTPEQIRAIRKKYAYLIRAVEKYGTKRRALAAGNPVIGEGGPDLSEEEIDVALLLSALSTAEQERDALKARCAELEARLQGAADRVDDFDDSCSESRECVSECHAYNNGKCMNAIKCDGKPNYPAKQPPAILGEKKD